MNPGRWAPSHKNSALHRLNKWMTHAGVEHYSFTNVYHEQGNFSLRDVDYGFLLSIVSLHQGIVFALGGMASSALLRYDYPHVKLPHPSSRNRRFNDPAFEPQVMDRIRRYVHG
jgi:hypothetical protein